MIRKEKLIKELEKIRLNPSYFCLNRQKLPKGWDISTSNNKKLKLCKYLVMWEELNILEVRIYENGQSRPTTFPDNLDLYIKARSQEEASA